MVESRGRKKGVTMSDTRLAVKEEWALTSAQFQTVTEVPPENERCGHITNPRTRTAYECAVKADFGRFLGSRSPEECRMVT
jgi:hypothetical protein